MIIQFWAKLDLNLSLKHIKMNDKKQQPIEKNKIFFYDNFQIF